MITLNALYKKLYAYADKYYPDDLGKGFFVCAQEGPTEWGMEEEEEDTGPSIDLFTPAYVNYETQAVAEFVDSNVKLNKKLEALASDTFNKTHSVANIESVLSDYLYNSILSGVRKLKQPFNELVIVALNNVSWESIVTSYANNYAGPAYYNDDEELQSLYDAVDSVDNIDDEVDLDALLESFLQEYNTEGYTDSSGSFVPYPPEVTY